MIHNYLQFNSDESLSQAVFGGNPYWFTEVGSGACSVSCDWILRFLHNDGGVSVKINSITAYTRKLLASEKPVYVLKRF